MGPERSTHYLHKWNGTEMMYTTDTKLNLTLRIIKQNEIV